MIKFVFGVFLICFSLCLNGQNVLSSEESGNFVGHEKTVCGKVVQSLFAFNKPGQPTLLMLDKPFPNQMLTIVIFDKYKSNFDVNIAKYYTNKNVCVCGKIELNRDKLEIKVESQSDIKVVETKPKE